MTACGAAMSDEERVGVQRRAVRGQSWIVSSLHYRFLLHSVSAYDHITANLPDTIRTQKSNVVELSEYSGGGPRGK